MLKFTLATVLLALVVNMGAQTFTNVANNHGIQAFSNGGEYGGGVSFFDYNGDGWDDLTICRNSLDILRYRNVEGSFEPDDSIVNNADAKQVTYADIDNDGDYDVLVTRNYSPLQLLLNNNGDYTDISESSGLTQISNGHTFGAAWGDYDKDGFLDVYVCNYNWGDEISNWLFHNNGDLTFTELGEDLGVDNGSLTSFQAVWLDINHDTWPDLYVVNDKIPPNAMFLNQGNGSFTDISASSGSNIVIDGMTNSVADFNHDGLLDIYITDDGPANQLLQNQGNNFFSNVAPMLDLENSNLCWGAQWIDWDNDSNRDLYFVTTTPVMSNQNYFYKQDVDGLFSQYPQAFLFQDEVGAFTNAKADFDQNGYEDLILGCHTQNARLYQNSGASNNFLRIGLEGVISNKDGIGSWITCHFNGMTEHEYTICGEAFMSQNSHYDVFGLGQAENVDSLIVEWPSGHIDTYYDIPVNGTIELIEGASLNFTFTDVMICAGDSICMDLPLEYEYEWSTGSTSPVICLQNPGNYWLTGQTTLGIPFSSDTFQIVTAPVQELEVIIQNVSCYGGQNGDVQSFLNGAVPAEETLLLDSEEISSSDLSVGNYLLQIMDEFGCVYTDSISITQPDSMLHSLTVNNNPCFGDSMGSVEIETEGGTPPYNYTFSEEPIDLDNGELTIWITDNAGCADSLETAITSPDELQVTINIVEAQEDQDGSIFVTPNGGSPPYEILWDAGSSEFELDIPAGNYHFVLTDEHNCELDSIVVLPLDLIEQDPLVGIIYPNPASDEVHIPNFTGEILTAKIYDCLGNLISVSRLESRSEIAILHVSHLAPGAYILYIYHSNQSHHYRLVID